MNFFSLYGGCVHTFQRHICMQTPYNLNFASDGDDPKVFFLFFWLFEQPRLKQR